MKVYFDNAATTPADRKVVAKITEINDKCLGNPSSVHEFGQNAKGVLDISRQNIASILNCEPSEIIFTSGGSEANNLAIRGLIEERRLRREKAHIITSKIEHHSVLHTIKELEKEGKVEATYLNVDEKGLVNLADILSKIKKNTVLVSIMYVNNETGSIQSIREIGKAIEKINQRERKNLPRIYFHSDAIQAAVTQNLDVLYLHIDLLTLSAHKIHGPKGSGLLYIKSGTPLKPQITGGSQENGKRAGTENTSGTAGFSLALKMSFEEREKNAKKIKKLKDYFLRRIKGEIPNTILNGDLDSSSPHIINISFRGAEAESILLGLDMAGIAASSGSACTSETLEPSHVLVAMGIKPLLAQSSIRFSFSKRNTKAEIDYVIKKLKSIVKRLRDISPIK